MIFTFPEKNQKKLEKIIHQEVVKIKNVKRIGKAEIFAIDDDINIVDAVREICMKF